MTSSDEPPQSLPDGKLSKTMIILALVVFIDMAGIGLILPVLPDLIMGLSGQTLDRAAEIGGLLLFAYAMMQFLFSPIIGGISDRFGRRPVLLLTLTALGLDYVLMAWAPTLAWLFVGRIISGIMGATWAAANSCIADVSEPENRGRNFGRIGAAGGAGFVLGPAIGGLLGQFGERLPFVAAAILALGGAAMGYFWLGETLPKEKRRSFSLARANPLGSLIQMKQIPLVMGILLVIFILQLGAQSQHVWAYFNKEVFGWSLMEIGLSVSFFGILLVIAQGGLTGPAIVRFGEKRAALFSLAFGIPTYLIFAFANQSWMMIAGILVGGLTGVSFPAMQSIMTSKISEDAQGELQGAIASIIGLTSIIGPIVMLGLFGAFADKQGVYFPSAPYLLAMILMAMATLLLYATLQRYYHPAEEKV